MVSDRFLKTGYWFGRRLVTIDREVGISNADQQQEMFDLEIWWEHKKMAPNFFGAILLSG